MTVTWESTVWQMGYPWLSLFILLQESYQMISCIRLIIQCDCVRTKFTHAKRDKNKLESSKKVTDQILPKMIWI